MARIARAVEVRVFLSPFRSSFRKEWVGMFTKFGFHNRKSRCRVIATVWKLGKDQTKQKKIKRGLLR